MPTVKKCWEYMKCGMEAGGGCPVVAKDAGYMCWIVAGTLCGGKSQGRYVEKAGDCKKCSFYQYIHQIKLE